ncbi:MAG TPA: amidohydrolase family protein [Paludibaculum sp.]|jgi:predicted TIM-barrel fold metal-dependent hydrolase
MMLAPAAAPIIDTHTHFYDPERPQGVPWPRPAERALYRRVLPLEFIALSRPHGVTRTIVVEASPWLEDNQWVLDLAKDHPVIAGLVGHLNPGEGGFGEHLARFHRNPLFLGIRLGGEALAKGLAVPLFVADLRRLAGEGLQVDLLGGAAMLADVARLARAVPELRIVINHLPLDVPGGEALAVLREYPRVYAKVSGRTTDAEGLDELWRVFGEDRLIYGSNWPVSERVAPYERIFETVRTHFAGKGETALRKYFWDNARTAYRFRV